MQRNVEVELVTMGGIVKGMVQVPTGGRLSEKLNDAEQFLPIIESAARPHPTLINKDQIALAYEINDPDKQADYDMVVTKISCPVQIGAGDYWIEGDVKLVTDASLQIFISYLRSRFVPVLNATVKQAGEDDKVVPIVIVNRLAIVTIDQSSFVVTNTN